MARANAQLPNATNSYTESVQHGRLAQQ